VISLRRLVRADPAALLVCVVLGAAPVTAQVLIPGDRPGDERIDLPPFEPPKPREGPILPPYPIPEGPDTDAIAGGVKVFVREIHIQGNTVVPTEELRRIAEPYEGRALAFAELLVLRDLLTLAYVDRGYVTSGAVLPPQTIEDGVLVFEIVEGELRDLVIETDGRFRDGYLRKHLTPREGGPINVYALQKRLQTLQRDRRIQRVDARLVPSEDRGLAILQVRVTEATPYRLSAEFNNYRNPSIGSWGGPVRAELDNAIGIGDFWYTRGTFTEGLRQVEGLATAPLTVWDTLLTVRGQWSEADVVSDPIASVLDIESRSWSLGIELRQPLYRSHRIVLETFLRAEVRRAQSLLDGQGFPFAEGPDVEGKSKVSVLRWGLQWTRRSQIQALALRSVLSGGVDVLDATINPREIPDGRYLAWLAQGQWALRLPWLDAELLARGDVQLADDPLLPLEQFAMGGRFTVRGYRENTLVRDNGLVGSLELSVPLFRRIEPQVRIEAIPFVDAGYSWNTDRKSIGQQTLVSAGIGTRMFFLPWFRFELYWGHRFKEVPKVGEYDLQDDGISVSLSADWP
jgi:hemolysin activation/secretion protein